MLARNAVFCDSTRLKEHRENGLAFLLQLPCPVPGRLCLHEVLYLLILDLEGCHVNRVHLSRLLSLINLREQSVHQCLAETYRQVFSELLMDALMQLIIINNNNVYICFA